MTRNFIYSTISAASAGLMLVLLLLAGRAPAWTLADYGAFTFAIALSTIAEVLMDFGLHQVTIRAVARDVRRAGPLLYTPVAIKALPGLAMIIIFGAATILLTGPGLDEHGLTRPVDLVARQACWLMLLSATMRSYLLTARGVLQGLERFGDDAFVTTLDRLLLVVACGIALARGATVVQVSGVFLAVRVCSAVTALLLARHRAGGGTLDRTLWKSLPAEALPIGLFLLVLNLYNRIDGVMLYQMAGSVSTGLYNAAYPLYEGATYPPAILAAVLMPRLARLIASDPITYSRLVRQSLWGILGLAVAGLAAGWPLVPLGMSVAYPGQYGSAATTLRVLLVGLPAVYVIWVLHAVAMSAHKNKVLLWVTGIGTVLNVVLNAVLIPGYAENGSAAATVVSEYVVCGLLWFGLKAELSRQHVLAIDPAVAGSTIPSQAASGS